MFYRGATSVLDVDCKKLCDSLGLAETVRTRAWDSWKQWHTNPEDTQVNPPLTHLRQMGCPTVINWSEPFLF